MLIWGISFWFSKCRRAFKCLSNEKHFLPAQAQQEASVINCVVSKCPHHCTKISTVSDLQGVARVYDAPRNPLTSNRMELGAMNGIFETYTLENDACDF